MMAIVRSSRRQLRVVILALVTVTLASCNSSPEIANDSTAACWVLSKGGEVTIREQNKNRQIKALKQLPFQGFTVFAINLKDAKDFTGSELREIYGLAQLRTLILRGTQVQDADLKNIEQCSRLETLDLANTKVSDDGLESIAKCTALKVLNLAGTQVVGNSFDSLSELKRLQELDLTGTSLVKADIQPLADCHNLNRLILTDSGVPTDRVKALKKALKYCAITN